MPLFQRFQLWLLQLRSRYSKAERIAELAVKNAKLEEELAAKTRVYLMVRRRWAQQFRRVLHERNEARREVAEIKRRTAASEAMLLENCRRDYLIPVRLDSESARKCESDIAVGAFVATPAGPAAVSLSGPRRPLAWLYEKLFGPTEDVKPVDAAPVVVKFKRG